MEIPDITLFAVIAAWLITQIFTVWGAKHVIKKAQKTAVDQKHEIQTHFDAKLDAYDTSISELRSDFKATVGSIPSSNELVSRLENLELAFNESMTNLGTHLEALPKESAEHIKAVMHGIQGVQVKETQRLMDEAGVELDEAMSLEEAYLSRDPEIMKAAFANQLNNLSLSKEYVEQNPIRALVFQTVKAQLGAYAQALSTGGGIPTSDSSVVKNGYRALGT
jgi:hypothetical protein